MGQTEGYVEYDRAGRVIKGQERATAKSRYEEDVHEQNHTKVWGSFWQAGRWGYACCRSFQKNSYCTGKKGLDAADAAADLMKENLAAREAALEAKKRGRRRKPRRGRRTRAGRTGRGRRRRTRSMPRRTCGAATSPRTCDWIRRSWRRRSGERMREGSEGGDDERKRGYNVSHEVDVTEEDMEAYRMKRQRKDDPMNAPDAGTDGYDLV